MTKDKNHLKLVSNVLSIDKKGNTDKDKIEEVRSFMKRYNKFIDEQLKAGFIPRQMLITQLELDGQIHQYEFVHNLDHSDMALLLLHVQQRLVNDQLEINIIDE